jgi:hypothetical protein
MVNRIRTLLMNRGRDGYDHDFPGEEYVEGTFIRKKLSTYLLRFHQALFGREPDRLFLNFRLRQLMTLIHSTELEEYVSIPDPRITYLPLDSQTLFDEAFTPSAIQTAGDTAPIYVSGVHEADEAIGLAQQSWKIENLADNMLRITRQRPRLSTVDMSYAISHELSTTITLPGSALNFRIRAADVGATWRIHVAGRPARDIGQVIEQAVAALGDEGLQGIFPPLPTEPLLTFRNVWTDHPFAPYRYAALLLAFAEQIDRAPQDT